MNKNSIKDSTMALGEPAVSPLQYALDRLDLAMSDNMSSIDVLQHKLSPVLVPWITGESEDVESAKDQQAHQDSELVNKLNSFITRLQNRTASIRDITDRLDT